MSKTTIIKALALSIHDIKELSDLKVQNAECKRRAAEFSLSQCREDAACLNQAHDDVYAQYQQALADAKAHRQMYQELEKVHDELAHKHALSVEEVDSLKHQLDKAKRQSDVAKSHDPAYQKLEQEFLGFRAGHEQAQQRWRAENDRLRQHNEKLQKYKNKLLKEKNELQDQLLAEQRKFEEAYAQIINLENQ